LLAEEFGPPCWFTDTYPELFLTRLPLNLGAIVVAFSEEMLSG